MKNDASFKDFNRSIGSTKDALASLQVATPYNFSREELERYFINLFPVRRACTVLPTMALQKGGEVRFSKDEDLNVNDAIQRYLTNYKTGLGVYKYFRKAQITANLHGGAALVLFIDDGNMDKFDEPVNLDKIKSIRGMRLFDKWEIYPDPGTRLRGELEPEYWRMGSLTIHNSRVIPFYGPILTERAAEIYGDGWRGDTIVRSVLEAVKSYVAGHNVSGHALQNFEVLNLKIENFYDKLAADDGKYGDAIADRSSALLSGLSSYNMLVTDSGREEIDYIQRQFAGVSEILSSLEEYLSAAIGLPKYLLFQRYGSALGQLGEHEQRSFAQLVSSIQQECFQDGIEILLYYLFKSKEGPLKGKEPEGWSWRWHPVFESSEREISEIRKLDSETFMNYLRARILSSDEIRESIFGGSEYSREIQLAVEEEEQDSRSDDQELVPPQKVMKNAKRVVSWKELFPDAVHGPSKKGWQQVYAIARGEQLSYEILRQMAKMKPPSFVPQQEPWKERAYVVWLGYGGHEGLSWARHILQY